MWKSVRNEELRLYYITEKVITNRVKKDVGFCRI